MSIYLVGEFYNLTNFSKWFFMSKLSRTGLQYLSKNKHNFAISRNVLRYVLTIHFFSYWFLWRNCNQFFDNCVFKTALQSFIEKTLITKWNSCVCSLQACFSVLLFAKIKNVFNFFFFSQPLVQMYWNDTLRWRKKLLQPKKILRQCYCSRNKNKFSNCPYE